MNSSTLAKAIEKTRGLPASDQDRIGRDLGIYIDDLRILRAGIDKGVAELDAGLGRELDIEDVIADARAKHAED